MIAPTALTRARASTSPGPTLRTLEVNATGTPRPTKERGKVGPSSGGRKGGGEGGGELSVEQLRCASLAVPTEATSVAAVEAEPWTTTSCSSTACTDGFAFEGRRVIAASTLGKPRAPTACCLLVAEVAEIC